METQNQQTKPLNNIYAWILAFMPFFFGVSPEEYTNYAIIIGGVTTIGLLVADRMALSESGWICPYISRHLLSLNPLLACCRRYSRGER